MFFKASEKTHFYQFPFDRWFTLFLLPHLCFWGFFVFFKKSHIIMQCLKSFKTNDTKQNVQLRGSCFNSQAFMFPGIMLKHCAVVVIARHLCIAEGSVCPVVMKMLPFFFFFSFIFLGRLKPKPDLKWPLGLLKHVEALPPPSLILVTSDPLL